jgi:hypothetical protein
VSARFAAIVRPANVIAFGPHRSRALTMFGELAETGQVHRYNAVRRNNANGYITPKDYHATLSVWIGKERVRKIETTRRIIN